MLPVGERDCVNTRVGTCLSPWKSGTQEIGLLFCDGKKEGGAADRSASI